MDTVNAEADANVEEEVVEAVVEEEVEEEFKEEEVKDEDVTEKRAVTDPPAQTEENKGDQQARSSQEFTH